MGETEVTTGESYAGAEPKKKQRVSIHWSRPKSNLYEYNYNYGENYYQPMIEYLNKRSEFGGRNMEIPKPQFWEERALKSYMDRAKRSDSMKMTKDSQLLQQLSRSSSSYIAHQKTYARRITSKVTY